MPQSQHATTGLCSFCWRPRRAPSLLHCCIVLTVIVTLLPSDLRQSRLTCIRRRRRHCPHLRVSRNGSHLVHRRNRLGNLVRGHRCRRKSGSHHHRGSRRRRLRSRLRQSRLPDQRVAQVLQGRYPCRQQGRHLRQTCPTCPGLRLHRIEHVFCLPVSGIPK